MLTPDCLSKTNLGSANSSVAASAELFDLAREMALERFMASSAVMEGESL